jgi:FMN-dependent NADH-azoreductase
MPVSSWVILPLKSWKNSSILLNSLGGKEADSSHMELRASCLRAPFDLTGVAGLASVFADSTAVTLDLD